MKLKLDLHPIFSDSQKIERGLVDIIAEAVQKKASEVEIIPGKGSGALKKTVLRFLERPEIKSQYHRVEKDDENFGRIFVHFRFQPSNQKQAGNTQKTVYAASCFCCTGEINYSVADELMAGEVFSVSVECAACGSPNKMTVEMRRNGKVVVNIESGY